jgi:hypothetical protein
MPFDLKSAVVRILDPSGKTSGTGFLVSGDGLIFTCFHVLSDNDRLPDTVSCQFLSDHSETLVEATVISQYCKNRAAGDFAVLKVKQVPSTAAPVRLVQHEPNVKSDFKCYGFPKTSPKNGMWGTGKVGESIGNDEELIQLHDASGITRGYSGGPVVIEGTNKLVGMVRTMARADKEGKQVDEAFAVPADFLAAVCDLVSIKKVKRQTFEGEQIPEEWSKYCNRDNQYDVFESSIIERYSKNITRPKIYFILGHNQDMHKSLVIRFKEQAISLIVEENTGGSVVRKRAERWPFKVGLESRKNSLKKHLLRNNFSGLGHVTLTAKQLIDYQKYQEKDAVVIQHDVQTKEWDNTTKKLLDWYCNDFWNIETDNSTKFIIFVCIIYSVEEPKKKGLLSRIFGGGKSTHEKINTDLDKIISGNNPDCTILEELNDIDNNHIDSWINQYDLEGKGFEAISNSFFTEEEEKVPMKTVEITLEKEIKAYNKKQNNQFD